MAALSNHLRRVIAPQGSAQAAVFCDIKRLAPAKFEKAEARPCVIGFGLGVRRRRHVHKNQVCAAP